MATSFPPGTSRPVRRSRWRALLALAALLGPRVVRAAEPPPIEAFFDAQAIQQLALSPDGEKIAMIAPSHGRYSVALLDTATGRVTVPVHFKDENITSLFWKGNDRILFYSSVGGHEVPLLASTDLEGKNVRRILEPRREMDDFSIFFGRLVDAFPASDDHILIVGFTSESDARKVRPGTPRNVTPSIYQVNVETGRRLPLAPADLEDEVSYVDQHGQLRLVAAREGNQRVFKVRARNDQRWRVLRSFDLMDVRWDWKGVLADGRTALIVDSTEHDRGVLRTLDLDTGELGPVLHAPDQGEVTGVLFAPGRSRLLGVRTEGAKRATHWLDEKWRGLGQVLETQFPGLTISVLSISRDEKRFVFVASSDRDPGTYYLADLRGAAPRIQPLSGVRPAIKPALMSPMEPVEFHARDGLKIHGYLTKPGGQANAKTPLLVMPHGGPFGIRDSWGFHSDVQFLASRGYAVLQVNFRGSGGYGAAFLRAGFREWSGKMQDDLTDGVRWTIAQGWADPERVGIIGASYGGYAALVGVTQTPELYKVGINYVGVSDLRLITRWDLGRAASFQAFFDTAVGRDADFLKARSPVEHVVRIQVPTLHAYGKNDPRVEFSHWEALEKALKKHGKTYEILVEESEGHGFRNEATSLRFYRAVEAFLAKYLVPAGTVKVGESRVIDQPAKP